MSLIMSNRLISNWRKRCNLKISLFFSFNWLPISGPSQNRSLFFSSFEASTYISHYPGNWMLTVSPVPIIIHFHYGEFWAHNLIIPGQVPSLASSFDPGASPASLWVDVPVSKQFSYWCGFSPVPGATSPLSINHWWSCYIPEASTCVLHMIRVDSSENRLMNDTASPCPWLPSLSLQCFT